MCFFLSQNIVDSDPHVKARTHEQNFYEQQDFRKKDICYTKPFINIYFGGVLRRDMDMDMFKSTRRRVCDPKLFF